MRLKLPTGKQILIPGMILAVAALGLLFFLQIRWMNNSLQAQNLRYRRGVIDAMNHVARSVFERSGLGRLDRDNPESSLQEWRENSEFPGLVKSLVLLDNYRGPNDLELSNFESKEIYLLGGEPDRPYLLTLDSALLYEQIFPESLREYSLAYSYRISYGEATMEDIIRSRKMSSGEDSSVVKTYLPLFVDFTEETRRADNLLFNPGDFLFYRDKEEDSFTDRSSSVVLYTHLLEIDLNDERGSAEFEKRLRRTNLALIFLLCLILVGIYYLLLRLYRREENQRRVEQTFVASVSHELRTPIAVIKTASENLARGIIQSEERVQSYGQVIGTEADRLNRLVEGILYYSRMEGGGRNTIHREEVNPRLYTGEILDRLRLTYPDHPLEADLAGAPRTVSLDRDSYRLILDNLITNAILHGDGSPLRIRLENDFPARWRLVVEDDGPGLPRREQRQIFDPFVRGKNSEDKQIRGSGLGLFLVKRATEALGGSLALESPYQFPAGVERSGCRFTVILPIKGEEERDEPHSDD
ncbi:MAG: HAMP domain-containing sensor histidine kinase [Spirochaetales bacterium]|nr:HAMP domain-containing sensor histidine kinase [Spirochaetales bacterium]